MTERRKRRAAKRLTLTEDKAARLPVKRDRQYQVWDSGTNGVRGLSVLVSPKGARSYRATFYYPGSDKPHSMHLGRVGEISLEEARQRTRNARGRAREGEDPASGSRERSDSLKAAIDDYVARELINNKEAATAKHAKQQLLKATEGWHYRPVATIRAQEIQRLLWSIRDGSETERPKRYLANAVHGRMRAFFGWCAKPGIGKVGTSPMIGIDKPWGGAKPRERHFSDDELRAIWKAANKMGVPDGAFVKLLLLTGKRVGALKAMRWSEISDTGFWTPPPGKKFKRNHPVPLSGLALRVLKGMPRKEDQVFPGRYAGTLFSASTRMQRTVAKLSGVKDFFAHACRHTVETRLASLRVPPHIRDLLLDHAPQRGSGKGYDHHSYEPEMREAAEVWTAHIEQLVGAKGVSVLR